MKLISKWDTETDPKTLRRCGKTGEELAELAKVLNRIIIQGYYGKDPETGEANSEMLSKEIADVYAQLDETVAVFKLDEFEIHNRRLMKREQMQQWENFFV